MLTSSTPQALSGGAGRCRESVSEASRRRGGRSHSRSPRALRGSRGRNLRAAAAADGSDETAFRGAPAGSSTTRRSVLLSSGTSAVAAAMVATTTGAPGDALAAPELVSNAWEKLGGGQADIYYPGFFEGCWTVSSTLVSIDTPKGIEYTNDAEQIRRARENELNQTLRYDQCFVRNAKDRVVASRALNTKNITEAIIGRREDIQYNWNVDDPNVLKIKFPGLNIFTRVTRRFSSSADPEGEDLRGDLRSMETSELFEQVFDKGVGVPKVKASRLITKWKWRSVQDTPEGEPQVIASQTLNNYVTPGDSADVSDLSFTNLSEPASIYKYRMAFVKAEKNNTNNDAMPSASASSAGDT